MKNRIIIPADNDNLYEADKNVRDFIKVHKGALNPTEKEELGVLLDQRAAAISDALGVKVGSVVQHNKK